MKAINKRLHRIAATHESVSLDVRQMMKTTAIRCIRVLVAVVLLGGIPCAASDTTQASETIIVTVDAESTGDASQYLTTTNSVTFSNDVFYCAIHQQLLREDLVPVLYGLTRPTSELLRVQQTLFPHAATCVYGGCFHSPNVFDNLRFFTPNPPVVKVIGAAGSRSRVLYCPICREAKYERWKHLKNIR